MSFFIYIILLLTTSTSTSSSHPFKCTSPLKKCDSLIDYIPANTTTLLSIQNLFNIKNLRTILGVNNLPFSTPPTQLLQPKHSPIKIPIPCICTNGTGKSNKRPIYKVGPGDTLERIANEVFAGLVSYQEIQEVNKGLVRAGKKIWIPLPCSCDEGEGEGGRVVHYGHLVEENSTVEGIAEKFNSTKDVILKVNGLVSANDVKAGDVLDVPLKACSSSVSNNSLDYPLLVSSGTYIFTAANCVKCTCDAANNWTLQCEPSQLNSSLWHTCPSMECQGYTGFYLGNISSYGCERTTCSYSGYTNQTILTSTTLDETCPASDINSSTVSLSIWRVNFIALLFIPCCSMFTSVRKIEWFVLFMYPSFSIFAAVLLFLENFN